QQVFKQIAVVADSDLPVLITGETGTGKELVAQAIARHSSERSTPYLVVSPAALNPDSLESQLFGANQGIFNQSDSNHVGYFERADGGTLLLDEIGDLPLFLQVKLLRVLEQQSFSRVGDLEARKASVRILASTNRDLRQAVLKGEFREDLYHRLSGMLIHLPTLSERKDDIPLLCSHFLSRVSAHIPVDPSISDELMDELKERPWHGNARELRNATEHAAIVARGRKLTIEDFPPSQPGRSSERPSIEKSISDAVETWTREKLEDRSIHGSLQPEFLAAFESELFKQILKHTDGNRAQAAQWLGLHRATLRDRLRSYGIE
ncbi:MAG: sigma-54 dependent transcriptional regulator, partial [Planctomycetota bacterium]